MVHRSQRDPMINDPEASKYVLLSSALYKGKEAVEVVAEEEEDDDDDDDDLPALVSQTKPTKSGTSIQVCRAVDLYLIVPSL